MRHRASRMFWRDTVNWRKTLSELRIRIFNFLRPIHAIPRCISNESEISGQRVSARRIAR